MNAQVQASAQRLCSPCVIAYRPGFKPFSSASLPVREAQSCVARPRQLMGAMWSRPAAPQPGRITHSTTAAAVGTERSSATFVVSIRVLSNSELSWKVVIRVVLAKKGFTVSGSGSRDRQAWGGACTIPGTRLELLDMAEAQNSLPASWYGLQGVCIGCWFSCKYTIFTLSRTCASQTITLLLLLLTSSHLLSCCTFLCKCAT